MGLGEGGFFNWLGVTLRELMFLRVDVDDRVAVMKRARAWDTQTNEKSTTRVTGVMLDGAAERLMEKKLEAARAR